MGLKSHAMIVEFLYEITTKDLNTVGLQKTITEPTSNFICCVGYKVSGLMDPPNRMLQGEPKDLITAIWLIHSISSYIEDLCSIADFVKLWAESMISMPQKQQQ